MLPLKVFLFFKSNKHKLWYYCWKINFRVKSTSVRGKFMAWIGYLPFVIHRRKFTTETTMIFVFALLLSSFRALIDSLYNMFYFANVSLSVQFHAATQVLNTGIAPARLVDFQRWKRKKPNAIIFIPSVQSLWSSLAKLFCPQLPFWTRFRSGAFPAFNAFTGDRLLARLASPAVYGVRAAAPLRAFLVLLAGYDSTYITWIGILTYHSWSRQDFR